MSVEPEELKVEEQDIRALIERLTATGAPQSLDTLTEWFVGIVIRRESGL